MALTSQDIARVANLARLELRPDETEHTLSQINGFFALVEQMEAVNTEGVEPLAHPAAVIGEVALRLREDIASEPNQREASQAGCESVTDRYSRAPRRSLESAGRVGSGSAFRRREAARSTALVSS